MEEIRKCIYCDETMKYGKNTQVLCKNILKHGKPSYKTVRFIYYGWRCSMKNDYCDIVMDEQDYEKISIIIIKQMRRYPDANQCIFRFGTINNNINNINRICSLY
jgi:hypothetical protein